MEAGIVEQVEEWESEPFSGGYGGLHDLADRGFTGAVTTGGTYLFMLNGRAIGVFDLPPAGSPEAAIEVFEDASGTAYEAPHPSLPLLFTMYLSDGETRAQYYTEDTPIEEVDNQLTEGGFTGYIELSENVLSGDYYIVYQAGRSMSAAFVGASERLYTDEEAFERAADEVGIYDVVSVDIDVVDIPDTGADESTAAVAGGTTDTTSGTPEEPTESPESPESTETEVSDETEEVDEADEQPESAVSEPDTAAEASDTQPSPTQEEAPSEAEAEPEPEPEPTRSEQPPDTTVQDERSPVESDDSSAEPESATDDAGGQYSETTVADRSEAQESVEEAYGDTSEPASTDVSGIADDPAGSDDGNREAGTVSEVTSGSRGADLTVRSVPSLDPERSGDGSAPPQQTQGIDARDRRTRTQPNRDSSQESTASTRTSEPEPTPQPTGTSEEVASLQSALSEREEQIEELEAELAEAADERDDLRAERDRLREERDELEATIQELRQRIRDLESQDRTAASGETSLTPQEALAGSDLFIRYRSKSDPTLEAVADGAPQTDVTSNLQLERHTRFDATETTVAGEPYDSFLQGTLAYRFVRWAIEDLIYEIRDTGHTSSLRDLYDALPQVDRAELQGTVSIETEEGSEERSFDVVLRNRMGDPLVVANLDTSRQPTGGEPMRSLIEDATTVANGVENLSAAFFVTSSFFESDALETARNETGTGLLSRDKRKSVVKLSRKRGYHLCLVEARDESFHLTVPEL